MLGALNKLNERGYAKYGDPETQTRIAQYEMAFRMQASVPELTDITKEPKEIVDMYGRMSKNPARSRRAALACTSVGGTRRSRRAGPAPRLGISIAIYRTKSAPSAATSTSRLQRLIKDLKQRGLLDSTLVVWGGEFGRTVYSQGTLTEDNYGRDHHPGISACGWQEAVSNRASCTVKPTTSAIAR
jgi:hypothetical protein